MIRNANKVKRMEHCKEWIAFSSDLEDMLFSDETSVALESNARFCNRKKGRVVNKPVPKHPAKIHVWGGITRDGPGPMIMFKGILDTDMYKREICDGCLLPWVDKF